MAKETFKLSRVSKVSLIAEERLYLTSDRQRVVREGDKAAAYLLAGKGQVIPPGEVIRLGLSEPESKGTEPEKRSTRPAEPDLTR